MILQFGKLLRCMILSTLALLLVCLVRFLFLPGALDGITHYVKPRMDSMVEGGLSMTIIVLQAFGSGWGSIMALSSFNNFKTNIMSYSWIIAFGQTLVYILFGLVTFMLDHYFESKFANNFCNILFNCLLAAILNQCCKKKRICLYVFIFISVREPGFCLSLIIIFSLYFSL